MYVADEDFLGPVLEDLRNRGLIENYQNSQSRFNISFSELEKPEVKKALAKACGLEPDQISIPHMIEFNILGSIHHPEWGDSNCTEWFADKYDSGKKVLTGGSCQDGGFAHVTDTGPDNRPARNGFRLVGRFQTNPTK